MHITLSPCRGLPGAPETTLSVAGDVLTVDGAAFDLSGVPEGAVATPSGVHPFVGTITREGGEIRCTVRVILGDTAALDQLATGWTVTVSSGAISLPATRIEEPAA